MNPTKQQMEEMVQRLVHAGMSLRKARELVRYTYGIRRERLKK